MHLLNSSIFQAILLGCIIFEMQRGKMHRKTLCSKLCLVEFHIDFVFAHSALERYLGQGSNR